MVITSITVYLPGKYTSAMETLVRSEMMTFDVMCQIHAPNHAIADDTTTSLILTPCKGVTWTMNPEQVVSCYVFSTNGFSATIATETD